MASVRGTEEVEPVAAGRLDSSVVEGEPTGATVGRDPVQATIATNTK